MTSWLRFLGPALLGFGLAACDAPLEPEALDSRDVEVNPPTNPGTWPPSGGGLNTAWLGNTPLMRLVPPGSPWPPMDGDAVVLDIEVFDGEDFIPVTDVDVPEGMLILTTAEGTYEGEEVVGSRWWLDELRTNYVTITAISGVGGTFGYQFDYIHGDLADIVCDPSADGDHWAYLVEDVFVDVEDASITPDDGFLLVACATGALGKAITWGFSPWYVGGDDDLDLYRTGVRTVRADFCGTGVSYTEDGTPIQVRNALAGRDFWDPTARTEAIFGPDGALCLTQPRIKNPELTCELDPCEDARSLPSASYQAWTKVATEIP